MTPPYPNEDPSFPMGNDGANPPQGDVAKKVPTSDQDGQPVKPIEQQSASSGAQEGGPNGTPPVSPEIRAAQLSDKAETIDAPFGETTSPKPPEPSPKKRRKKKNIGRLSVRIDDDIQAAIDTRMAETGCSESEAARQLILDGIRMTTRIIITPQTPPEHLEVLLGEMRAWRRDFQAVKSRLNSAMPKNLEDNELRELVRGWRDTSKRLLERVPVLEDKLAVIVDEFSALDGERSKALRSLGVIIGHWHKVLNEWATADGETGQSPGVYENAALELREILEFLKYHGFVE